MKKDQEKRVMKKQSLSFEEDVISNVRNMISKTKVVEITSKNLLEMVQADLEIIKNNPISGKRNAAKAIRKLSFTRQQAHID